MEPDKIGPPPIPHRDGISFSIQPKTEGEQKTEEKISFQIESKEPPAPGSNISFTLRPTPPTGETIATPQTIQEAKNMPMAAPQTDEWNIAVILDEEYPTYMEQGMIEDVRFVPSSEFVMRKTPTGQNRLFLPGQWVVTVKGREEPLSFNVELPTWHAFAVDDARNAKRAAYLKIKVIEQMMRRAVLSHKEPGQLAKIEGRTARVDRVAREQLESLKKKGWFAFSSRNPWAVEYYSHGPVDSLAKTISVASQRYETTFSVSEQKVPGDVASIRQVVENQMSRYHDEADTFSIVSGKGAGIAETRGVQPATIDEMIRNEEINIDEAMEMAGREFDRHFTAFRNVDTYFFPSDDPSLYDSAFTDFPNDYKGGLQYLHQIADRFKESQRRETRIQELQAKSREPEEQRELDELLAKRRQDRATEQADHRDIRKVREIFCPAVFDRALRMERELLKMVEWQNYIAKKQQHLVEERRREGMSEEALEQLPSAKVLKRIQLALDGTEDKPGAAKRLNEAQKLSQEVDNLFRGLQPVEGKSEKQLFLDEENKLAILHHYLFEATDKCTSLLALPAHDPTIEVVETVRGEIRNWRRGEEGKFYDRVYNEYQRVKDVQGEVTERYKKQLVAYLQRAREEWDEYARKNQMTFPADPTLDDHIPNFFMEYLDDFSYSLDELLDGVEFTTNEELKKRYQHLFIKKLQLLLPKDSRAYQSLELQDWKWNRTLQYVRRYLFDVNRILTEEALRDRSAETFSLNGLLNEIASSRDETTKKQLQDDFIRKICIFLRPNPAHYNFLNVSGRPWEEYAQYIFNHIDEINNLLREENKISEENLDRAV